MERRRYAVKKIAGDRPKAKKPNAKKLKKNEVSTSTGTTSGTTTRPCPVIEEHKLSVSMNPYYEHQSQKEKKEQRAFTAEMRRKSKKKAS